MIRNVANAYSGTEYGGQLNDLVERIYDIEVGDPQASKDEMELQKQRDKALREFGDVFRNAIKSDEGNAMLNVVNGTRLEGMPYIDDTSRDKSRDQAKFEFQGLE